MHTRNWVVAASAATTLLAVGCGNHNAHAESSPGACIQGGTPIQRVRLRKLIAVYDASAIRCIRIVSATGKDRLVASTRKAALAITVNAVDDNHLTRPLWQQGLVAAAYADKYPAERPALLVTTIAERGHQRLWATMPLKRSALPLRSSLSSDTLRARIRASSRKYGFAVNSVHVRTGLLPYVEVNLTASAVTKAQALQSMNHFESVFGSSPETSSVDGFFIQVGNGRIAWTRLGYVSRLGTAYTWRP
jgi:hypothetical protein